jgi:hypothetical protein
MAHALGMGRTAVALAGWIPLLTDFSFLAVLIPGTRWWTALLGGNLLHSLFYGNSAIPALAITLAALLAVARHARGEGRAWLAIALGLACAVPYFKVFLAAQLLLGAGVAFGLTRARALGLVAAACLATLAALAMGAGTDTVAVTWSPLGMVRDAAQSLRLGAPVGLGLAGAALLWLAAGLGLRLCGLGEAWRSLRSPSPVRVALAVVALSGWPIALVVRLSADNRFNEAVYFIEHSGVFLWLFTLDALARWLATRRGRWLWALLCAVLSLPATAEFLVRKAKPDIDPVPPTIVRAMRALARASQPGDVVLMRPPTQYPPPPVVFIGRRIPFSTYIPYRRQFAAPELLAERDRLVRAFFRAQTPEQARDIAGRLNARFVFLSGSQRVDFDTRGVLDPVFEEGSERVYRIVAGHR